MGLVESINETSERREDINLGFIQKHLSSIFLYFINLVPEITKKH